MIEVPMFETLASFWLTEHLFGATWTPERGEMGYDRIINEFVNRFLLATATSVLCPTPTNTGSLSSKLPSARTLRPSGC